MKKFAFLMIFPLMAFIVFISAKQNETTKFDDPKIPPHVKTVIDNNCYGCHSEKGKSDDAKKALMWDELANYERGKQVSVLGDIIEVIDEGEMPPKKFIEKYPDKKPSAEDMAILKSWAEEQIHRVAGS